MNRALQKKPKTMKDQKINFCFLLVGLLWLPVSILNAQSLPTFDRAQVIGLEEGLPRGIVKSITRDHQGFMWFGVFNTAHRGGLCRYDGTELKVFRHDPSDPFSLPSNAINNVLVDQGGDGIWVCTSLGFCRYDPHTETFKAYSSTWSEKVYQDRQGEIWVSLRDELDNSIIGRYNEKADTFQIIHFPDGPIQGTVSFQQDVNQDSLLWVGTFTGLWLFNKRTETFLDHQIYSHPDADQALRLNQIDDLFHHPNGLLYLSLWGRGISVYDPELRSFSMLPGVEGEPLNHQVFARGVIDIKARGNTGLWISTHRGLALYDLQRQSVVKIWPNRDGRYFGASYIDEEGGFWVRTNQSRVGYYHPALNQMERIDLFGVREEDEILWDIKWVPHANFLLMNSTSPSGMIWYDLDDHQAGRFRSEGIAEWFPDFVLDEEQGIVALGTQGGLWYLEPGKNSFQPLATDIDFPSAIETMSIDQRGDIWLTLNGIGVYRIDGKQKKVKQEYFFEQGSHYMNHVFEDSRGRIWLSLVYGFAILPPGEEDFTFYHSLTDHIIEYWEGPDGLVWMAILGKGIGVIDPAQPEAGFQKVFTVEDGLLSNSVYDLETDQQGNLWVATDQGLNVINPREQAILHAFKLDKIKFEGLLFSDFLNFCPLPDGRMALTYIDKVFLFDPEALQQNQQVSRPYISNLLIANEPLALDTSILFLDRVSLRHNQVPLTVQFSAFQYGLISQLGFQYRLRGVDPDWVEAGPQRSVTYSNLPPGTHSFEVRVREGEGDWQTAVARFEIQVSPPWWRTWWAYLLYVLGLVSIIFSYNRWRTATLRKRQVELERTVTERTSEVLAQKEVIEKEKERSDSLLLNILPSKIAEELKQDGFSPARDFDQVTVLFTDFERFTAISEQLTPQELVEEINICFKAFDEIITKYGIEKIKTIGDAYMAAGGLNLPRQADPKDVVLAGLEMQQFMVDLQKERQASSRPVFAMRCGIHTGPVVAGIVGVKKFQYDIWGDTVNTASRMENNCEAGKVNISRSTYERIKTNPNFTFVSRGNVYVKYKGEMDMFYVDLA